MKFKVVSSQVNFGKLSEEILAFWKKNKTFEKSIQNRPADKRWNFLDGPPFVSGMPHYGSLLSSMPKDVFGRYWTMKGYRVRRVWGWDGHGLPIENKVEEALGIKRKKDIEDRVGVKTFVDKCREYVEEVSDEWEWYVNHIGRWVDFKHAYKTWNLDYMESVMWVFKQIFSKGLIYKDLRVSLYCPHCSTPISNFEVAMDAENYQEITETSTTYKYEVKEGKNTYLLAWSTTPWNKIVTPALAVNPNLTYVKVKEGDEFYILGKKTLRMLRKKPPEIVQEYQGLDLVGMEFVPHYPYYLVEKGQKAFVVIPGDFVTEEEGTGIVTIAAYGEEDLAVMRKENVPIISHLDEEGRLKAEVPNWGGMYYLDVNKKVNDDLRQRGLVYEEKPYQHSVAHCWRCQTQLYYAPINAWFVNVQSLKDKLRENNGVVNWFPKHFKYGRFLKSLEAAPDWNISRNRYWGSPVPVWECQCGERIVPGSIKELKELSGKKISDLHKPAIDEITLSCPKCQENAKRVPEVLDSWIEAGSASFAERHFPFSQEEKLEDFFPPDFIAEYTGQIRAWFYVLHVISTALYDSHAFKNVLVTGVILGTDGRKMSKNFGNYPDPKSLIQTYGGDALRVYLLGSPVMKGEDINFSNEGVPEVTRGFLLILWNSYKYFVDYANTFEWSESANLENTQKDKLTILDRWILSSLNKLVVNVQRAYDLYNCIAVVKLLRGFVVNDLSTWYIRRSRDRISNCQDKKNQNTALSILYQVLVTYLRLLAPIAPFISEEIYKNLTGEQSVHLVDFPEADKRLIDENLIDDMSRLRKLAEIGHARRKEANIKLRQPLSKFSYSAPERLSPELEEILAEELNVKEIEYEKYSEAEMSGQMDTNITPLLQEEGETRELIRQIQQLRKENGLTLKDKIKIQTSSLPQREDLRRLILAQTNAVELVAGKSLAVEIVK